MASLTALPPGDARPTPAQSAILRQRGGAATRDWRGWLALLAVALALMLRLMPADSFRPLDRDGGDMGAGVDRAVPFPTGQPDENFPGSAYFFAQDAFAPVGARPSDGSDPSVTTLPPEGGSPHVLQIENGPVALSMPVRGATFLDQARALQCMTNAIYYEAGNEPEEGQRAVAQVILNRMASGRWPTSVCGVIYQGTERSDRRCQFTFSCDGSMARTPAAPSWARARGIAARALSGETYAPAGLATFYHTLAVRPPWADKVRPLAVIGAHIFYRLPGEAGMPGQYRMRYSGREFAQPGPYAFAPPPRPNTLPVPPGPELLAPWGIAASGGVTQLTASTAAPVSSTPARPMTAAPQGSYGYGYPPATTSYSPEPGNAPGLPQSTVRAEYRNSGRQLR